MEITIDEYWRLKPTKDLIIKLCNRENRLIQLIRYGRSYGIKRNIHKKTTMDNKQPYNTIRKPTYRNNTINQTSYRPRD